MWTCECGCQNIAADLAACPMCWKEREVPKATSGGTSNAWEAADVAGAEVLGFDWEPSDAPAEDGGDPVVAAPVEEDAAPVKPKASRGKKAAAVVQAEPESDSAEADAEPAAADE